jgi:hypothetical protein
MSKDIFETHYPALRNIILHGLLYEQLKYAIRRSVIIIMMDAVQRSSPSYTDPQTFTDAYCVVAGECVDKLVLDSLEIIMNSVGNGTLRDGIYSMIGHVNTVSYHAGQSFAKTGKVS